MVFASATLNPGATTIGIIRFGIRSPSSRQDGLVEASLGAQLSGLLRKSSTSSIASLLYIECQ